MKKINFNTIYNANSFSKPLLTNQQNFNTTLAMDSKPGLISDNLNANQQDEKYLKQKIVEA